LEKTGNKFMTQGVLILEVDGLNYLYVGKNSMCAACGA
jgi:hypothetical protein